MSAENYFIHLFQNAHISRRNNFLTWNQLEYICCDVEERFQMSPAIMEFLELKHWGQLFQNLDGFRDNLRPG